MVMNVEIRRGTGKIITLRTIEELPEKQRKFFCQMVDECILDNNDREWREAMAFVDGEANRQGITFYDLVLQLYEDNEILKRVDEWREEKGF